MRLLNQSGHSDAGQARHAAGMLKRFAGSSRATASCWSPARPVPARRPRFIPACIDINRPDRKIITVEDPVEYQLAGINQVQVNEKVGLTFARALRSILRQDAGRDAHRRNSRPETAHIAVQASLTGHLVFSTLHTNDAPGALTRLVDMGASSLTWWPRRCEAVLAQRLVRRVCESCTGTHIPTTQEAECWRRKRAGVDWAILLHGHGVASQWHGLPRPDGSVRNAGDGAGTVRRSPIPIRPISCRPRVASQGKTLLDAALREMKQGRTTVSVVMRISNQAEE